MGARNLSVLGALVFFWCLWHWDFPKPMCDDLFYSGSGLNLAEGGDLSNPLLIRQHFPEHLFLIYPPIHSYALAGWLKVFGINAAAMIGFQILMYIIVAVATISFLRREKAPNWLEWIIPPAVACAFINYGLRPEPLAAALTMWGFAWAWQRNWSSLFPGFFLMALGAATAPRITLFSASLILVAGLHVCRDASSSKRRMATSIPVAAAGILTAFLVFLVCLDFRLAEFWRAFHHYSQLVSGSKWQLLIVFFKAYVGVTQWLVFPLFLVLLMISIRAPWHPLKQVGVIMAATFLPVALIGGLGDGTLWFALLGVFALAAAVLNSNITKFSKALLTCSLLIVILFANIKMLLNIAGIVSGNIITDTGVSQEEALALRSTTEHPVLVDEFAARYVYDYRIPSGFIYWPFSVPFPVKEPVETKLYPEDVYVLGPLYVDRLVDRYLFKMPPRPMWGFWQKRWSFYRHPRAVYVIPANEIMESQGKHAARIK